MKWAALSRPQDQPGARTKTLAAASALRGVWRQEIDEATAGILLRAATGRQWSLITAAQYLSGKEARIVWGSLPAGGNAGGLTKAEVQEAILLANVLCARGSPHGGALSAGRLVEPIGELFDAFRREQEGQRDE